MNLYRLSQTDNCDYDTYDSCVVAAKSEEDAKSIHPSGHDNISDDYRSYDWVDKPSLITCELIGAAVKGTKRGVICASFNAG